MMMDVRCDRQMLPPILLLVRKIELLGCAREVLGFLNMNPLSRRVRALDTLVSRENSQYQSLLPY